jgi:hypothetical protein
MSTPEETLLKAAGDGDKATIEATIGTGIDVNCKDEVIIYLSTLMDQKLVSHIFTVMVQFT